MKLDVYPSMNLKQREVYRSKAKRIVFPAGRRFGKGEFAARWQVLQKVVNISTEPDYVHSWIAPSYRQAKLGFAKVFRFLQQSNIPFTRNISELFIDIIDDKHRLQFFSSDRPQLIEGYGFKSMVVDEAGIVLKEPAIWHNTLAPACMDYDADILFTGTPKGKNYYHVIYNKGLKKEDGFESYHATSYDNSIEAGGFIPRSQIDFMVNQLPRMVVDQEIYANFLDDGGEVFRGIRDCIRGEFNNRRLSSKSYFAGVDLARTTDYSVVCILDNDAHVVAWDRFNGISWALQKERIIKMCRHYDAYTLVDSTGVGDPIFEDLTGRIRAEGFKFDNTKKRQIIESLAMAIERGTISFPNIVELISELETFTFEVTKTGVVRYGAPEGMHDDCVIALALANHAYRGACGGLDVITDVEGRIATDGW